MPGELAHDRFQQSQYYRRYYAHIGAADLAGFLTPPADKQAVLISIGRRASNTACAPAGLSALRVVTPLIRALVTRQVKSEPTPSEPPGRSLHEQFEERFEGFAGPC